jgi:hypothetical protein
LARFISTGLGDDQWWNLIEVIKSEHCQLQELLIYDSAHLELPRLISIGLMQALGQSRIKQFWLGSQLNLDCAQGQIKRGLFAFLCAKMSRKRSPVKFLPLELVQSLATFLVW